MSKYSNLYCKKIKETKLYDCCAGTCIFMCLFVSAFILMGLMILITASLALYTPFHTVFIKNYNINVTTRRDLSVLNESQVSIFECKSFWHVFELGLNSKKSDWDDLQYCFGQGMFYLGYPLILIWLIVCYILYKEKGALIATLFWLIFGTIMYNSGRMGYYMMTQFSIYFLGSCHYITGYDIYNGDCIGIFLILTIDPLGIMFFIGALCYGIRYLYRDYSNKMKALDIEAARLND